MESTTAIAATEHQTQPETRLWQAVILHTIQEWTDGPLRRSREAEQFLFNDNSDFKLVCASAGMDAENLRRRLEKLRKRSIARPVCQVAA
jgi:hypothetical protein